MHYKYDTSHFFCFEKIHAGARVGIEFESSHIGAEVTLKGNINHVHLIMDPSRRDNAFDDEQREVLNRVRGG